MTPLERWYRRLLLAYPASWRDARGEELLGVLLEWAPDEQTRPTFREALDVIGNGLRTRISVAAGRVPGDLRERMGLLSLGSGAALSLYCLLFGEYVLPEERGHALVSLGPVYSAGIVLYGVWLVAAALAVAGVVRNLRRVAAVLLGTTASLVAVRLASPNLVVMPPLNLLALFAGLSAFGLFGTRAATRSDRAAMGTATAALSLGVIRMSQGVPLNGGGGYGFYRWTVPNLADGSWLIVAAYWLTGAVARIWSRGWLRAAVVASLPWVYFSLVPVWSREPDMVIGLVGGVGLLALVLASVRLDRRRDQPGSQPT